MRNCPFPKGFKLKVSVEDPSIFPAEEVKRLIELHELMLRNKSEESEYLRLRRSFAKAISAADCDCDVIDDMLIITVF